MRETTAILERDDRVAAAVGRPVFASPRVLRDARGWLTSKKRFAIPAGQEPLQSHADWPGPIKLTTCGRHCAARVDIYAGGLLGGLAGRESAAMDGRVEPLPELVDCLRRIAARQGQAGWTPPDTDALSGWLAEGGYSPVLDEERVLHWTLPGRGRAGQIRLAGGPGRLRMTMRLGAWPTLDPVAARAMLRLARDCNAACRLARVAWLPEGDGGRRCEAQVDFSGLPVDMAGRDQFWPDMLHLAVSSMELVLRRLGLELEVLADPGNAPLARRLTTLSVGPGRRAK